jgi:CRP-like cAMP-binding protein
MRRDRKLERIKKLSCFASFSDKERALVGRLSELVSVDAQTVLFDSADRQRTFLVITEGVASVHRDDALVATLGSGEHFGHVEMYLPTNPGRRVIAETRVEALTFGPREFAGLVDSSPAFRGLVVRGLVQRADDAETRGYAHPVRLALAPGA